MPGIGAMLHELSGGSEHSPREFIGKEISKAEITSDKLLLDFSDGTKISVEDDGQSCCESRYMTCDDEPSSLVGGKLLGILDKKGPPVEGRDYDDCHEVAFLEVQTDKGFIVIAFHNEHNGYYGGFGLSIKSR